MCRPSSFARRIIGKYAGHLPHGSACRRLGADLLGEGTEFDAPLPEVVEHGDQVAQAAAQAVKFPDNERGRRPAMP